jgi:GH25 family lysozyme M1 (1,4-beta-N-acetylmuramidase)
MSVRSVLTLLFCIAAAGSVGRASTESVDCARLPGAVVPEAAMCGWFKEYVPRGSRAVDPRIEDRFPTASANAPPIRSFAFVVSVSKYPQMDAQHRDLAAVRTDLPNIVNFLKEQQFDEVIVLEDEAATNQNIRMVFERYLVPQMSIFGGRARFLFAFDGHGSRSADPSLPGGLALSTIEGENDTDPDNSFPLADLASRLQVVASLAYQSVALLGSCYSGGIFPRSADAQSYSYSLKPGAHVVASAKQNQFAWTLGGTKGTVFFEYFLSAVRNAQPRPLDQRLIISNFERAASPDSAIVRLERAVLDVNERLENTNNPMTNEPFPQLQIGAMAPNKKFEGAFFFLGRKRPLIATANGIEGPSSLAFDELMQLSAKETVRTGSSIKDRPDVAVFNVPETYKIRGIDVSSHNLPLDYRLLKNNDIQFVYARATQGASIKDQSFVLQLKKAREAQLRVGAYHVFSFCEPTDAQFANISRTVAVSSDDLPLALSIEWFDGKPGLVREMSCRDITAIKRKLLDLSRKISERYKKKPVLYVSSEAAVTLIDGSFDDFPIWLANYNKKPAAMVRLNNAPPRPWTLWQFTESAVLPGVQGKTDLNAFFGSKQQFEEFVAGEGNVALSAAGGSQK